MLEPLPIPYILNVCEPLGIVADAVSANDDALFNSGFVRKNSTPKPGQLTRSEKCKRRTLMLKNTLFATGMPFPNCCLVIAHLVAVIITGIPLLLIVAWAVVENSFLVGEPGARTYTIMDVL